MTFEPDDRDLAVLLFTWQSRFVTTKHLQRAFWPDALGRRAAPRLRVLREEGLLGFQHFPWLSERLLYFPTRVGNRALAACGLLTARQVTDCPRAPEALSPALRHDLGVVDIRLGLEESGADGRTWVSDHELRQRARALDRQERVPDGVFTFTRGGAQRKGVLEYERVPYHRSKIPALLARLRDRYEQHTLFVVCASAARAVTFRSWAEACGVYDDAPSQMAFSDHKAAAEHGLKGAFVDLVGKLWAEPGY